MDGVEKVERAERGSFASRCCFPEAAWIEGRRDLEEGGTRWKNRVERKMEEYRKWKTKKGFEEDGGQYY